MPGPDQDPQHDAAWRRNLAALSGEDPPPADAEQRTVEELRRAGRLGHRTMGRWTGIALQIAAGVVLLLGGLWWGRRSPPGDNPAVPRFALLLLEDSTFQGATKVGHDSLVDEYSAWAGQLAEHGNLVLGEELEPASYSLGPESPATDRVTGLFVIAAENLEAALRIARTCPHLRYGGGVVVRPIQPT
jgi:hypothetical protein